MKSDALRINLHVIGLSCFVGLLAATGPTAHAATIMINNGLAPPNPANVIDHHDCAEDHVYVRNVGCPPGWPGGSPSGTCPTPGGATEVALVSGGSVESLWAHDSSTITMSGGFAQGDLVAHDSSTITMNGGNVSGGLGAHDSSTITMSGGGSG